MEDSYDYSFKAEVNYSLAEFAYNEDFVLDLMEAHDENPVIQGHYGSN